MTYFNYPLPGLNALHHLPLQGRQNFITPSEFERFFLHPIPNNQGTSNATFPAATYRVGAFFLLYLPSVIPNEKSIYDSNSIIADTYTPPTYVELADMLNLSEAAIKDAMKRLKQSGFFVNPKLNNEIIRDDQKLPKHYFRNARFNMPYAKDYKEFKKFIKNKIPQEDIESLVVIKKSKSFQMEYERLLKNYAERFLSAVDSLDLETSYKIFGDAYKKLETETAPFWRYQSEDDSDKNDVIVDDSPYEHQEDLELKKQHVIISKIAEIISEIVLEAIKTKTKEGK